ncbi:MAG: four helix bundle protein [Myxococcota bacterium]
MKRSQAPIYVKCFDLTLWLLERSDGFSGSASALFLRDRLQHQALETLELLSQALQFRGQRLERLERANALVMALRIGLRLAEARKLLEPRQLRYAMEQLDGVGNMLGGWLRSESPVRDATFDRVLDHEMNHETSPRPG